MHIQRRHEGASVTKAPAVTAEPSDFDAFSSAFAVARADMEHEMASWRHCLPYSLLRVLALMPWEGNTSPAGELERWMRRYCRGEWRLVSFQGLGRSLMCLNDDECAKRFHALFGVTAAMPRPSRR
jgi:hypothetical protein